MCQHYCKHANNVITLDLGGAQPGSSLPSRLPLHMEVNNARCESGEYRSNQSNEISHRDVSPWAEWARSN